MSQPMKQKKINTQTEEETKTRGGETKRNGTITHINTDQEEVAKQRERHVQTTSDEQHRHKEVQRTEKKQKNISSTIDRRIPSVRKQTLNVNDKSKQQ